MISPLLANVYLHELDMHMQRWVADQDVRRRRRMHGKANFAHIRYADDFVVMCDGTKRDAEVMKQEIQQFLATELKLTLSDEKTKITHVNDGFRFLGFDVQRETTGTGLMWPKHTIPADTVRNLRAKVMEITSKSSCNHAVSAKLIALNRLLRGWGNYYRTTHFVSREYAKLDHFVFWQVAHWLGTKFKIQMPRVMRQFRRRVDGTMTLGTDSIALWRLSSLDFGILRKRTFVNPYLDAHPQLGREELSWGKHHWSGIERRPGTADLRLQVFKRDDWTCQHCHRPVNGVTGRIDHIRPVKRFKRPEDAHCMSNLQVLCIRCHDKKTKAEKD